MRALSTDDGKNIHTKAANRPVGHLSQKHDARHRHSECLCFLIGHHGFFEQIVMLSRAACGRLLGFIVLSVMSLGLIVTGVTVWAMAMLSHRDLDLAPTITNVTTHEAKHLRPGQGDERQAKGKAKSSAARHDSGSFLPVRDSSTGSAKVSSYFLRAPRLGLP